MCDIPSRVIFARKQAAKAVCRREGEFASNGNKRNLKSPIPQNPSRDYNCKVSAKCLQCFGRDAHPAFCSHALEMCPRAFFCIRDLVLLDLLEGACTRIWHKNLKGKNSHGFSVFGFKFHGSDIASISRAEMSSLGLNIFGARLRHLPGKSAFAMFEHYLSLLRAKNARDCRK